MERGRRRKLRKVELLTLRRIVSALVAADSAKLTELRKELLAVRLELREEARVRRERRKRRAAAQNALIAEKRAAARARVEA